MELLKCLQKYNQMKEFIACNFDPDVLINNDTFKALTGSNLIDFENVEYLRAQHSFLSDTNINNKELINVLSQYHQMKEFIACNANPDALIDNDTFKALTGSNLTDFETTEYISKLHVQYEFLNY